MHILFCSSEAYPFSKSGGLADMASALPKIINQKGEKAIVITPFYDALYDKIHSYTLIGSREIQIQDLFYKANYYETYYDGVTYIFVENEGFFKRANYYGYYDDDKRFLFFSYAILEYIQLTNQVFDLLHLNDWQTGLVPFLLDDIYRVHPLFRNIKTLLTIHNLEYQGSFPKDAHKLINRPFTYAYIHFDRMNYLKAGIMRANHINTVSPTYKEEVQYDYYGFTLDGALKSRINQFSGILNGIDYDIYNPETDPLIEQNFNSKHFTSAKKKNKLALLKKLNLDMSTDTALVAYIGRLAKQKGIDLMMATLEEAIAESTAKFVFIGSGDPLYEDFFRKLQDKYRNRVYSFIGFNNTLAHQLYASADILMMPSQFEPCGLGQLMAMRYGCLPLVRETGGLKDTVMPYNKYTKEGHGFSFANYNAHELKQVLLDSILLYANNPDDWKVLVKNAMKQDHSLDQMGLEYLALYQNILQS
ncbi:MAG: glycogen synthase [Acholeplasma sp.]|nr:glycogen synthase [Acholeplasma sp.]